MEIHPLQSPTVAAGPLAGVGVIVTRPQRQAAGLVRKLATLGATPLVWPAIVILPPADAAALARTQESLGRYDLAVFVSANAVEFGVADPRCWPAALAVFAPGPGTAEALAAVGIDNVRIPVTTFDSEGLLALPELRDVAGKRVLILRGDGGRELLGDTLHERGALVDYVSCYRRAAPQSGADGLLEAIRDGRAHALTLTSSEGLDNVLAAVGAKAAPLLQRLPIFVPHPRIAVHARSKQLDAIATAGGDAGLIAGLLDWFSAHPVPGKN